MLKKISTQLLLKLVIFGVCFDLIVSLGFGLIAKKAYSAASSAHIARVASYESCLKGNEYKTNDALRWAHVLTLIDTMPKDHNLQVFIDGVAAANAKADAPATCTMP